MSDKDTEALLVLPHLRVQNANAISSPLTWGFPAITAFTGFTHALQRRLAAEFDLEFVGVAVVCHSFLPQVAQPASKRTLVFSLTRNPLDKDGSTAAIVEEGRVHLDVSLIIGVCGNDLYAGYDLQTLANRAFQEALAMRIAGGSVIDSDPVASTESRQRPSLCILPDSSEQRLQLSRKLAYRLLPGFALVSREALLENHLASMRASTPDASAIDALLDLSRLNMEPPRQDAPDGWRIRAQQGWLVPIPVGYAAISPLYSPGQVRNARDRNVPFRFVESVFSIGEWISPHRVENVCHLLWRHRVEPDGGLYRYTTPFFASCQ
jgi:CRISPR-associated protein Csy2